MLNARKVSGSFMYFTTWKAFEKKTEEMMELLMSLPDAVPNLLKHVECPMIMDLLLKIIALDRNEGGQGVVEVCISILNSRYKSDSSSGYTPRISSRLFCHVSALNTTGSSRLLLVTSSRLSLPSLPMLLKTNSNVLVPTN